MACCSFKPLQSGEQFSVHLCKYRSIFISPNFHSSRYFSPLLPINTHLSFSSLVAKSQVNPRIRCFATSCSNSSNEPISFRSTDKICYSSSSRSNYIRAEKNFVKNSGRTSVVEEENVGERLKNKVRNTERTRFDNSDKRSQKGPGFKSKDVWLTKKFSTQKHDEVVNGRVVQKPVRNGDCSAEVKGQNLGKRPKKSKADPIEVKFRTKLDMCSKNGDVIGAISLYDSAPKEELKLGQYHYTVLLYLCSSAAMGVIRPAKSGSGTRSLDMVAPPREAQLRKTAGAEENIDSRSDKYLALNKSYDGVKRPSDTSAPADEDDDGDDEDDDEDIKDQSSEQEIVEIWVSEDVKKYALERGFEIYEKMRSEEIPMNEASLTSIARMAMAMGNGDMAFDMVKQMKTLGINPKLRSYGPALSAFCSSRNLEKAFEVEKHMLENGVHPEEPELEALLRVSVEVGKADMVYYLLHKLREAVRSVSYCTADLIETWFKSIEASRVGKRKWDPNMILREIEKVGGGWHGQGWLGRGKWTVTRTSIADDGSCKCCGVRLTLIDLDPEETEKFAESVASIAAKREKNSSFQKFQKWLSYYGPYEAVVDAANVGLYSQRKFKPSKVNAVVNGIRQILPSKTWPLIVLHNRRVTGRDMDKPVNKALVEKWRNADALYATPTGSNDDWYWLYAAIKLKCLLVTNDEMRDHTFQLLGNDFFPKWKERHQVRFSFSEIGPVFHMPPPYSVMIQESEIGHWHIPIVSEHQSEGERTWLCITRSASNLTKHDSASSSDGDEDIEAKEERENSQPQIPLHESKSQSLEAHNKTVTEEQANSTLRNLRNIILASEPASVNNQTIRTDIEIAEKLGNCVIDFQI